MDNNILRATTLLSDYRYLNLLKTVPYMVLDTPGQINTFIQIMYNSEMQQLRAIYMEVLADKYDNICKYSCLHGMRISGIGFKYSYPDLTQEEMYFRPLYLSDIRRFIPLSEIPEKDSYIAFQVNHQGNINEVYVNSGNMSEYRLDLETGEKTNYYHVNLKELDKFDPILQEIIKELNEYIDPDYKVIIAKKDGYVSLYIYLRNYNDTTGSIRHISNID